MMTWVPVGKPAAPLWSSSLLICQGEQQKVARMFDEDILMKLLCLHHIFVLQNDRKEPCDCIYPGKNPCVY